MRLQNFADRLQALVVHCSRQVHRSAVRQRQVHAGRDQFRGFLLRHIRAVRHFIHDLPGETGVFARRIYAETIPAVTGFQISPVENDSGRHDLHRKAENAQKHAQDRTQHSGFESVFQNIPFCQLFGGRTARHRQNSPFRRNDLFPLKCHAAAVNIIILRGQRIERQFLCGGRGIGRSIEAVPGHTILTVLPLIFLHFPGSFNGKRRGRVSCHR